MVDPPDSALVCVQDDVLRTVLVVVERDKGMRDEFGL